ncbi:MAG: PilZ domain-containing protein [Acidobacteriota bacterium]
MSISQRQHIRFSLDIPARIYSKFGETQNTTLQQISVGGCFTGWEENIYAGDEFRMEIMLPNGNYLPLRCKALYRFDHTGLGVKFIDVTQFEQELISNIIAARLEAEGVPLQIDPFNHHEFVDDNTTPRITDPRKEADTILNEIMSPE